MFRRSYLFTSLACTLFASIIIAVALYTRQFLPIGVKGFENYPCGWKRGLYDSFLVCQGNETLALVLNFILTTSGSLGYTIHYMLFPLHGALVFCMWFMVARLPYIAYSCAKHKYFPIWPDRESNLLKRVLYVGLFAQLIIVSFYVILYVVR